MCYNVWHKFMKFFLGIQIEFEKDFENWKLPYSESTVSSIYGNKGADET